jgi:glutamyl-Q tRNA(Asp) synthetase
MPERPVFRFAPSPNGALHLGHALSALVGYRQAKAAGGRFLLRIEDIDRGRTRPEFVAGVFQDLLWLGLKWEEPVVFQSSRMAAYALAARRLEALGLLYPCFATRSEIEAAAGGSGTDPDGALLYPGLWKGRSEAEVARLRAAGVPCAFASTWPPPSGSHRRSSAPRLRRSSSSTPAAWRRWWRRAPSDGAMR